MPVTGFPMRANGAQREPVILQHCSSTLYTRQHNTNTGSPFVLHDGPPFANGPPHMGHALNKILKDIICRYKMLRGHRVNYIPGWDCHGLPIEVKALGAGAKMGSLTPVEVRRRARALACDAMVVQEKAFRRWGVTGDWEHPYRTMDKEFEVQQLHVFKTMFDKVCTKVWGVGGGNIDYGMWGRCVDIWDIRLVFAVCALT